MKGIVLQIAGAFVILLAAGAVWMLDLYGCGFNTSGCSRWFPQLTMELVRMLVLPVGVGTTLIIYGRLQR
jgi:hypothetical protein